MFSFFISFFIFFLETLLIDSLQFHQGPPVKEQWPNASYDFKKTLHFCSVCGRSSFGRTVCLALSTTLNILPLTAIVPAWRSFNLLIQAWPREITVSETHCRNTIYSKKPQTKEQILSFLGSNSYRRSFVPNYSALGKPLTHNLVHCNGLLRQTRLLSTWRFFFNSHPARVFRT